MARAIEFRLARRIGAAGALLGLFNIASFFATGGELPKAAGGSVTGAILVGVTGLVGGSAAGLVADVAWCRAKTRLAGVLVGILAAIPVGIVGGLLLAPVRLPLQWFAFAVLIYAVAFGGVAGLALWEDPSRRAPGDDVT